MKLYKTREGVFFSVDALFYRSPEQNWDTLLCRDDAKQFLSRHISSSTPLATFSLEKAILQAPIQSQEVWAAGVTYLRSKSARMDESKETGGATFYDKVYDAERPELFFKATPHRVVGSGQSVRIRKDSTWNVPEPELTLVLTPSGKMIGYTVGNDMSSRSIEGENPLYLPQAKIYAQSCALGPAIFLTDEPIPADTKIQLMIVRNQKCVFNDSIAFSQIKRKPQELAAYLFRDNSFPFGCFLMTGTGLVPGNDFTLEIGDEIHITIDAVGTLKNTVS